MWPSLATRPGASDLEIVRAERALGSRLPDDYKHVLLRSDGLEGFAAPDVYLALWSWSELVDLNTGYQIAEFLPGVTLIGTDGGDTGYGVTWENGAPRYFDVPLIGMGWVTVTIHGASFAELLAALSMR